MKCSQSCRETGSLRKRSNSRIGFVNSANTTCTMTRIVLRRWYANIARLWTPSWQATRCGQLRSCADIWRLPAVWCRLLPSRVASTLPRERSDRVGVGASLSREDGLAEDCTENAETDGAGKMLRLTIEG